MVERLQQHLSALAAAIFAAVLATAALAQADAPPSPMPAAAAGACGHCAGLEAMAAALREALAAADAESRRLENRRQRLDDPLEWKRSGPPIAGATGEERELWHPAARQDLESEIADLDRRRQSLAKLLDKAERRTGECAAKPYCQAGWRPLTTCEWLKDRMVPEIEGILATGERFQQQCNGQSCPILDCGGVAKIDADLSGLESMLSALATEGGVGPAHRLSLSERNSELAFLREMADALPALLQPGTAASQRDPRGAIEAWLSQLAARQQKLAERGFAESWRLLPIRLELTRALEAGLGMPHGREAALAHLIAAQSEIAAAIAGHGLQMPWPSAKPAAAERERLRHLAQRPHSSAPLKPSCAEALAAEADRLGGHLAALQSGLAQCSQRGGCALNRSATKPDENGPGFAQQERLADITERLTVAFRKAARLGVSDEPPVSLLASETDVRPGELVEVRLKRAGNQCMTAGTVTVVPSEDPGIAPPPASILSARRGYSEDRKVSAGGDEKFLFEVPPVPGEWVIRAKAPAARGGGTTGEQTINVLPPLEICDGFSGEWQTGFGRLRLYQRGKLVTGTYRRSPGAPPGYVKGRVKGRVFRGSWSSEIGEGGTRLVLAEDGESFSGTWGTNPGQYAGAGRWNGQCVAGATAPGARAGARTQDTATISP